MAHRPSLLALASLVTAFAACSSSGGGEERASTTRQAIVKGTISDDSQNATVLVMHYDALSKGGGAASGCTGSLLTPRLVLTARHCVSITDDTAACTSEGKPVGGGAVMSDHVPNKIYVFGGKDRPDFLSGNVNPSRGQEILTTGANKLCNDDIALVLLDKPVAGAKITPIRLDAPPQKGEIVTIVGFGIADDSPNPPTRRQRTGVEILEVGPGNQLGPAEFRIGEGTCQGDSGGPAIAPSGAVLGALSRGGNGTPSVGADACIGGTNIFSSIAGHADFIRAGYEKAGQAPWLEGQPNPTLAAIGGACVVDADCQSNTCNPDQKTCTQECAAPGSSCPSGFVCGDQNSKRVCLPKPKDEDGGCSIGARSEGSPGAFWGVLACSLAGFFARARRKKTAGSKAI